MTTDRDTVILVNQYDHAIGCAPKLKAHRLGQLHRAFSVFIFLSTQHTSHLLLQQRHPDKYHSGGLWTNTCCSHPRPGETVIQAAERRLQEEMGLKIPLKAAGAFEYRAELDHGFIEHEYDHVLIGYAQDRKVHPNAKEVIATEWLDLSLLERDWEKKYTHRFTAWFLEALTIALKNTGLAQRS